ncbi:MAG: hypothetical protein LQ350_006980 [Teloschistes chrysophthalmus]|nr:MAG: hypothetical protein LQ350_006980 [Niorma chrysophthalma]
MALSRKCSVMANESQREVEKLRIDKGRHRRAVLKSGLAIWKMPKLKEKQAKLGRYKQILDTRLLVRLDINLLKQSCDLGSLDRSVQDLAAKLESGLKTTDQLLADHGHQVMGHFDRRMDEQERRRHVAERRDTLMKSLFFPSIEARHEQVAEAFHGTCRWLLEPPEGEKEQKWPDFRDWLKNGTGAYWISGKPGSGKSTLMKYIVHEPQTKQYLRDWAPNARLIIASFFFWNLGTRLQNSAAGLLRSLLYQIAAQWEGMVDLSKDNSDDPESLDLLRTWTDQGLLSTFKRFLDQKPTTVVFCSFIDGLDEIADDEDQVMDIIRLLIKSPGCKVCVSSRPEQSFRLESREYPQLRVQDLNEDDLTKMPCLEENMPNNSEDIDSFVVDLLRKAEGVFLWLSLMTKDIVRGAKNGDTVEELFRRLERTPATLDGLYRQMLDRLDPEYLSDALRYFMILRAGRWLNFRVNLLGLICAEDTNWEYVKIADRAYFCDFSFDGMCRTFQHRLIARCGGFIEVLDDQGIFEGSGLRSYRQTVDFIQRTARAFLETRYEDSFLEPFNEFFSGIQLARSRIGLMFLFPKIWKLGGQKFIMDMHDTDHQYIHSLFGSSSRSMDIDDLAYHCFRDLIQESMASIAHATYFCEFSGSKGLNDTAQMTAQAFKTLRSLVGSNEVICKCSDHVDRDYTMQKHLASFSKNRDVPFSRRRAGKFP